MMSALRNHYECLSDKDISLFVDMYTATPSVVMTMADAVMVPDGLNKLTEQEQCRPCSPNEAAGSPAASITAVPAEKGALSSLEDDSSQDS